MVKVQLFLTTQEVSILKNYGSKFNYSLSEVIHHFIAKATKEILKKDVSAFDIDEETKKRGLEALEEYRAGKTIEVKDVDKFFNLLS